MNDKIHFVFSTQEGFYANWQSHLFFRTFEEMGLSSWARCTRLISAANAQITQAPSHPHYAVGDYSTAAGDYYAPINKPGSIRDWLENNIIEEPFICILDPDCLFLKPLASQDIPRPQKGSVIGSTVAYMDYDFEKYTDIYRACGIKKENHAAAAIPYIICTEDLKTITAQWLEETIILRQQYPLEWCIEMLAFAITLSKNSLRYEIAPDLCACNNEPLPEEAKILHYSNRFTNISQTWKWHKLDTWGTENFPETLRSENLPIDLTPDAKAFFDAFFKHEIHHIQNSV